MNVENLVNDVKTRTDVVINRGQDVVDASFETIKAVNVIIVDGVQALVETNVAAGKELVQLTQASFERAKTDGIKAVLAKPVFYFPEGKDTVVGAFNDSRGTVTKAGEALTKTVKGGIDNINATIKGEKIEQQLDAAATKAKKTVKKTAKRAKKVAADAVDAIAE